VDKVYIGDLAGQMWVFDVSFDEVSKKSHSQWKGQRLFKAPLEPFEKHNIFYQAAVAFDRQKNPWVYFGTGNRESPTDTTNPQERFYAVMDDGKEDYPRLENNLKDVTDLNTFSLDQTKKGWYIRLEKASKRLEKVLGKPTVFNKLLYFTTYFYNDKGDPCSVAGDPKLYVVEYLSGGGALVLDDYLKGSPSERSRIIGEGVPSSPVITANMKGKDSVVIGTTTGQVYSTKVFSPTTAKEILYWREVIP
jgi:Tfp pilus tip-associated adhesin PilY1